MELSKLIEKTSKTLRDWDKRCKVNDERIDYVNNNITIIQKKDGLTYGTDALLLSAFIRRNGKACAADFGSGSGIISFLCATRNKFKKIYAVEVQQTFSDIIDRNISLNNLQEKIQSVCINVTDIKSSTFPHELDVVFTNPPYMKKDCGNRNINDEKYIARHEVCGTIDDFCSAASQVLKFGGLFYAVYRPDRMIDLICSLRKYTLEPKRIVFVYPAINYKPCLMLIEAKKGAASSLIISEPLIMYEDAKVENKIYTKQLQYIYESGDFNEQYQKS